MASRHERPPVHPVRLIWRALAICDIAGREMFEHPAPVEEMSDWHVEWVFSWARESTPLNPAWLDQLRDAYYFRL